MDMQWRFKTEGVGKSSIDINRKRKPCGAHYLVNTDPIQFGHPTNSPAMTGAAYGSGLSASDGMIHHAGWSQAVSPYQSGS